MVVFYVFVITAIALFTWILIWEGMILNRHNPDHECYRVHGTTAISTDYCVTDARFSTCSPGFISDAGLGPTSSEFFGKICFSDKAVDWDLQFTKGDGIIFPADLWIAYSNIGVPPDNADTGNSVLAPCGVGFWNGYWAGNAGFRNTFCNPTCQSVTTQFVALGAASFATSTVSGPLKGQVTVTAEVGATLRASPEYLGIVADNVIGVAPCDWIALIDPASRFYDN